MAASNVPAWISVSYCAYSGRSSLTLIPAAPSWVTTSLAAAIQSEKLFGITMVIVACWPSLTSLPPWSV